MTDGAPNRRLIALTAAVALLAGGGVTFAAMKLIAARSSLPVARPPVTLGVGGFGLGGRLGGHGLGGGLGGLPHPRRGLGFGAVSAGALSSLTGYLGLSGPALEAALAKGETLAQVAKAQGKSVAGLVSAILAVRRSAIEHAVTAGRLTAAQARQIESADSARVHDLVNAAAPRAFGGLAGPRGGGPFAFPAA